MLNLYGFWGQASGGRARVAFSLKGLGVLNSTPEFQQMPPKTGALFLLRSTKPSIPTLKDHSL